MSLYQVVMDASLRGRGRFLLPLGICLAGCGSEEPAVPDSAIKVKLLGSVAAVPGKPVSLPGSKDTSRRIAQKGDAAYVWAHITVDGKSATLGNNGAMARVTYPDGFKQHVSIFSGGSELCFTIPGGYSAKPAFADFEVIVREKPVAKFRIRDFAEPLPMIGEKEPRMEDPPWFVYQDPRTFRMRVLSSKAITADISTVKLLRTSYRDCSTVSGNTFILPTPHVKDYLFQVEIPPQFEAELEQVDYGFSTQSFKVVVDGLEIENVFDTPVIKLSKAVTVKIPSGDTIEIPAQRIAPIRKGKTTRHDSSLEIRMKSPFKAISADRSGRLSATYKLAKLSPDLGAYGIWELSLRPTRGNGILNNIVKFTGRGPIKPGKLPPITLDFTVTTPKVKKIHKGIVPVVQG